ncbi:hypothetical protein SPRI_7065 [Streptomyces pristinaespiralis]|uniref:Uncharacterized protein n=1 Tax=Streptomyces pristinaespiralis TaxID=38300 RepID=A0A0M4DGT8_STRPR|nr:hypothetical protein SPRI_0288 [Streptomyces pristinaespiralis]ALC25371.1 hypothetical protein SPRI_7065 [Streptomyces pristinaespiralis]
MAVRSATAGSRSPPAHRPTKAPLPGRRPGRPVLPPRTRTAEAAPQQRATPAPLGPGPGPADRRRQRSGARPNRVDGRSAEGSYDRPPHGRCTLADRACRYRACEAPVRRLRPHHSPGPGTTNQRRPAAASGQGQATRGTVRGPAKAAEPAASGAAPAAARSNRHAGRATSTAARQQGVITGPPDAVGRGRQIPRARGAPAGGDRRTTPPGRAYNWSRLPAGSTTGPSNGATAVRQRAVTTGPHPTALLGRQPARSGQIPRALRPLRPRPPNSPGPGLQLVAAARRQHDGAQQRGSGLAACHAGRRPVPASGGARVPGWGRRQRGNGRAADGSHHRGRAGRAGPARAGGQARAGVVGVGVWKSRRYHSRGGFAGSPVRISTGVPSTRSWSPARTTSVVRQRRTTLASGR